MVDIEDTATIDCCCLRNSGGMYRVNSSNSPRQQKPANCWYYKLEWSLACTEFDSVKNRQLIHCVNLEKVVVRIY